MDEWRPLMCPNSNAVYDAFFYFALFLPTYNVLGFRKQGRNAAVALQGDDSGCAKPPVDIDLKVAF